MKTGLRSGAMLICLGFSSGAWAQSPASDTARIKQVVDGIVPLAMSNLSIPGFAVGISLRSKTYFFPYGTSNGNGDPFRPDTIVEIGSCTKVFTTTLVAQAALSNQLNLAGSIQDYLPNGMKLKPAARQVTPLELADFSSGMPDEPTDMPRNLQQRRIENYTTADFFHFVTNWEPDVPLPAPYLYSNASVGLLGYVVENATGKTWPDLLREEITGPLHMVDTVMRLNDEQRSRLAEGHHPNGNPAPRWPIFAWYAAGALRSTVADMLKFGEANLGHTSVGGVSVPPKLIAAMQLAQKPRYSSDNGVQHAMSWEVSPAGTEKIVMKNGGTAGYNSLILLDSSKDLAIFLVANQAKSEVNRIGKQIASQLH